MPRGVISAISERRIAEARAEGLFDNLPGHGKPIADLDRPRPPGWWAEQFVAKERHESARADVETDVRRAMPGIWRCEDEPAVRSAVAEVNAKIADYNRVTSVAPLARLDIGETLATWRRLRTERV